VLTLDKIKAQINSRQVLIKSPTYNPYRTNLQSQFRSDLYPIPLNYFHELNPFTTIDLDTIEHLNYCHIITLRDGAISFSDFLLNNINRIQQLETHFLIRPELAPLIPEQFKSKFSSWRISQAKRIRPEEADNIFLFVLVGEDLISNIHNLKNQFLNLKDKIKSKNLILFQSQRKSPFENEWKDSTLFHELLDMIKTIFHDNKINYVKIKDVMATNSWHKIYCIDLFENHLLHSDNYLNHFIAARGGTIERFLLNNQDDIIFKLQLSLYHEMTIHPLPNIKTHFPEILFYKKKFPKSDLLWDKAFHHLIKKYCPQFPVNT
jgi:hypothetical protein